MTISTSVTALYQSIYELFASLFGGIYHAAHSFVMSFVNLFTSFYDLVRDVASGAVEVVGGVGKFVVGNIFLLGIVALGGFAYLRYTQQGRAQAAQVQAKTKQVVSSAGQKKTN